MALPPVPYDPSRIEGPTVAPYPPAFEGEEGGEGERTPDTPEPSGPAADPAYMRRKQEMYAAAARRREEARALDQAMSAVARSGLPVAGPTHPLTGRPWEYGGLSLGDLRERRDEARGKAEFDWQAAGALAPAVAEQADTSTENVHRTQVLPLRPPVSRPTPRRPSDGRLTPRHTPEPRPVRKSPPGSFPYPPINPSDEPPPGYFGDDDRQDAAQTAAALDAAQRTGEGRVFDAPGILDEIAGRQVQEIVSSWGGARTQRTNDLVKQRCIEMAKVRYPELARLGKITDYVVDLNEADGIVGRREIKVLKNVLHHSGVGHSRPDVVLRVGNRLYFINTRTMKPSQLAAIDREVKSLENLEKNVDFLGLARGIRKLLPEEDDGTNPSRFLRQVDRLCKEMFDEGETRQELPDSFFNRRR